MALAADLPQQTDLPQLNINDLAAIADFVCGYASKAKHAEQVPGTGFLSVEAARSAILAALSPSSACPDKPLALCHGAVLAQDLVSPINVPPHANSAMDGIGLRGDDRAATPGGAFAAEASPMPGSFMPGMEDMSWPSCCA